jgi:hypothetical protein
LDEHRLLRTLFAITLFLSAALLFLIEPMFAKMVLPLAGGTPAVWNTCMVFFQAALLAGYAWAHFVSNRLSFRNQALLQFSLCLLPLAVLPIHLPSDMQPPVKLSPEPWIFLIASGAVGLPFFVLSTIAPTMQRWYAHLGREQQLNPYPLYAASNIGSILSLLAYPFLLEPFLGLGRQSRVWSVAYGLLIVLVGGCAALLGLGSRKPPLAYPARLPQPIATCAPKVFQKLRWVFLAAVPASLMLGVTTTLTTEIPPIPFLWVVPLAIYLLTFVVVFAERQVVPHELVVDRLPLLLLVVLFFLLSHDAIPIFLTVIVNWLAFFFACMLCHGELFRSRPDATHLTQFYLCLALGGVFGGLFNALIAPQVFHSAAEFPMALALAALCRPFRARKPSGPSETRMDYILPAGLCLMCLALLYGPPAIGIGNPHLLQILAFVPPFLLCLSFSRRPIRFALGLGALIVGLHFYTFPYSRAVDSARSFFGVYRIIPDEENHRILFVHGSTAHGIQNLNPATHTEPLSYYCRSGPLGQIFSGFNSQDDKLPVAVVGLGIGSIASYAQPGQSFTFFEIDPLVEKIARNPKYFTIFRDSPGALRVVIGDARLSLLHLPSERYRMLILDAFTSDSVPLHLLSREAFALYFSRLEAHGLLVFHVSNRYLNLAPVLANLAADARASAWMFDDTTTTTDQAKEGCLPSIWIVVTRDPADAASITNDSRWIAIHPDRRVGVWTDDFSNLVRVLRWD